MSKFTESEIDRYSIVKPARKRARRNAICWNHNSDEAEAVREAIVVIQMEQNFQVTEHPTEIEPPEESAVDEELDEVHEDPINPASSQDENSNSSEASHNDEPSHEDTSTTTSDEQKDDQQVETGEGIQEPARQ